MNTAYITHAACLRHDMGAWHPESPARLTAIEDHLHAARLYDYLVHRHAPKAGREALERVHDPDYVATIHAASPQTGLVHLDGDTAMNPHSLEAALHAAGGAIHGVDLVMLGEVANAFVACRPPGHHATRNQAMGFCIFNNVAVAAAHALACHGLERVAIVDFDVHHGNGTEAIFSADPRVMLCSSFQHPFYPFSGAGSGNAHIINVPLPAGTTGEQYRTAFEARMLPPLMAFKPQLVLVSAGFDSHREDDMAQFGLVEADYVWVTEQIMAVADASAQGRIVSVLEGGYELSALARSVAAHVRTLAGL
ncbi:MAG: histone deacetylase family protein [Pseudomonadota bacterium]